MNDEKPASVRELAFLSLLTLLNVVNFVDRQLLASFANFIVPDLGLSNTQFGLLTGFAFILFYAAMGLFMGALADLVHRPRLIAAGLALWSGLTALSGMATSFVSLALPRAFIGVGESALTPTSMSLLSDRFPARRLGFASGFYYMGVPLGIGVSLLIAGYLGPAIGWRGCFYALGLVGLVLSVVMLFVRETQRRHVVADGPALAAASATPSRGGARALIHSLWQVLRSSPALTLTIAGGVAMHFALGAATFDQLWYVQERGFERAEIARMTGWIGMIGGVAGNLFGGLVSDWWLKRTGTGRPMFLFWLGLVLAPFNLLYRIVPGGSPFFWIGVFTGYFGLGAFYGPTFSTVQELVPPRIRATVVAFYILMLNLIGLGFGITAGGWLIDRLKDNHVDQPYTITLVAFTVLSMLSTPLFLLAGRLFRRDRERLSEQVAAAA